MGLLSFLLSYGTTWFVAQSCNYRLRSEELIFLLASTSNNMPGQSCLICALLGKCECWYSNQSVSQSIHSLIEQLVSQFLDMCRLWVVYFFGLFVMRWIITMTLSSTIACLLRILLTKCRECRIDRDSAT